MNSPRRAMPSPGHTLASTASVPLIHGGNAGNIPSGTKGPSSDASDSVSVATIIAGAEEITGPLDDLAGRAKADPGAPFEQEVIEAAAALSQADFERLVRSLQPLGITGQFRKIVAKCQAATTTAVGPALKRIKERRPEPWEHSVPLGPLLREIEDYMERHVILPEGAAPVITLWLAHTYVFSHFRHTPRLLVSSPEKRCGKSTLLQILNLISDNPRKMTHISPAALYRTIEEIRPTILCDEADRWLRQDNMLIGIIDAGFEPNNPVIRTVGDDFIPCEFDTFAPMAIAGIGAGEVADTITDRSIEIRMRRALAHEEVSDIDRKAEVLAITLKRKLLRWAMDARAEEFERELKLPPGITHRNRNKYMPLFTIATLAGGDWQQRLIDAEVLLRPDEEDEGRYPSLLLKCLREIFKKPVYRGYTSLSTDVIIQELVQLDTMPWVSMPRSHKNISAREMWRMLKGFDVYPRQIQFNLRNVNGLRLVDCQDAFDRYLPSGKSPDFSEHGRSEDIKRLPSGQSSKISNGLDGVSEDQTHQRQAPRALRANMPQLDCERDRHPDKRISEEEYMRLRRMMAERRRPFAELRVKALQRDAGE